MSKTIVCIQCPQGCSLEVSEQAGAVSVTGYRCPRGLDYAKKELINPSRTLTSTVRTCFRDFPLLPVRTQGEVPLGAVFAVMREINTVLVRKRLRPGDVVVGCLAGTDVSLVATDDMTMGNELAAACR